MAYAFYRTVTIDHSQAGSSDSTDWPCLVSITDATLKTAANGGHIQNTTTSNTVTVPADLAFYDSLGPTTLLKWEVEKYVTNTGELVAWVKIPTLSHTSDVVIYLYYDDASVTTFQGDVNGTWNSGFVGVWHLGPGPNYNDSTANGNNGTPSGSPSAATGQIDGALALVAASSQYVDVGAGSSLNLTGNMTVQAWVNSTGVMSADQEILARDDDTLGRGYNLQLSNSGGPLPVFYLNGGSDGLAFASVPLSPSTWYALAGTVGTSLISIYQNGANPGAAVVTNPHAAATGNVRIGARTFSGFPGYLDGIVDEVRLSNVRRSGDWINADYNSQKTSQTMVVIGAETPVGGGSAVKAQGVRGWSWPV